MREDTTDKNSGENVIADMAERRHKRSAEERRKRNADFTMMVLSRWFDGGPASGRTLFSAILTKAANGPITPEQAEALLPVLLEVLDEMDFRESQEEKRNA